MRKIFVGLDIGTTSIKVSAVDQQLKVITEKQYHYDYLTPQKEWAEIDPETWVTIVLKGLEELFQIITPQEVAGIGITGQMHTMVLVDENGSPVRRAIMWNDHRTKTMLPVIQKRLLKHADTAHIANIVSTGSPLASLLWVKENEPNNYEKTKKILIAKDYVILRLTGVYSTDFCDASTSSLYDLNKDNWSETLQKEFGFESYLFPPIHFSSKVVGQLTTAVQQAIGIEKSIPMVAGTGDNVASALVSGSFNDDQPLLSLGTSGVVVIPNANHQLKETGKNVVAKIKTLDNTIITQGTVQAGAKTNSWWLEKILHTHQFAQEQANIPKSLLGNNEVLFFPHLNGEKTLFKSPDLRGAFIGLSLETTREEMYLAVLEGLAFGMRCLYQQMRNEVDPKYFTIVGGGAKSKLWTQLFANILNCPIKRIEEAQEAVHGAALLAIIGLEKKVEFQPKFQMIKPETAIAIKYEQHYQHYLLLTEALLSYTKAVKKK